MSDDKSDKSGSWFGNPLPIVMVVLLAAGVLVKNIPLESARPTDPERVGFVPTGQQDVEARLWQDPFAAVEKHEKNSDQAIKPEEKIFMVLPSPHTPKAQPGRKTYEQCSDPAVTHTEEMSSASHSPEVLCKNIKKRQNEGIAVTVVAVSVSGGSYSEGYESRRRSRFAVISALGFHNYHPENADALGYFHIDLPESQSTSAIFNLPVPYEWFETRGKSSAVLVLWLNEDKLTTSPLTKLQALFATLTPNQSNTGGPNVKLIGPSGSAMLAELISHMKQMPRQKSATGNERGGTLQVFAPGATISNCDLFPSADNQVTPRSWNCFSFPDLPLPDGLIRTTGTDDVLSAALLWELSQRGFNVDPWLKRIWATFVKSQGEASFPHKCKDGLVLIGERDTSYGRTLSRYLTEGFWRRCGAKPDGTYDWPRSDKPPVLNFSYLRGLDGVLPDIDKSVSKGPPKDDVNRSKDLPALLDDAPPEHAEGRSQLDYLRRLADEIDRLDRDNNFAENGVKAIGIVGSDLYDKLLILQALRNRFQDKIFFTTDLDARYLHADQKDWARNLVVASNFGLSLPPALQQSTLPFRDSYQTATYLATLMALKGPPLEQSTLPFTDSYQTAAYLAPLMALNPPVNWIGTMKEWLRPQIFEIGRTEAVHLASPSVERLKSWITNYTEESVPPAKETKCDIEWYTCESIEPIWPVRGVTLVHPWAISSMVILGLVFFTLANRHVNETVRTALGVPSPERDTARMILYVVIGAVVALFIFLSSIRILINDSLEQGVGEPFVWLEGISVWPSLVVRFVGFVTMLALWYVLLKIFQQQEKSISKNFEIALQEPWKLNRRWWSAALTGPHLNLASIDKDGKAVKRESAEENIEVTTLWQNYLRATRCGEMVWWIVASILIGCPLAFIAFQVLGSPSFPHRGELVLKLHVLILFLHVLVLWTVIFWAGYETRACARFIETLSGVPNKWPDQLLDRKAKETGVPRAHLDDYLDFQLIVRATQRIHWLIYLPFVSILFMVIARSNFFDAMDFPLALVLIMGLALTYALYSAWLLRKSAEKMRVTALKNYEKLRSTPTWPPINEEEINLLMESIRNTREGAFAPFAQQPALRALLLPFGGYGSVQLIEYLINLKV